jgi:hypothetical protein
LVTSKVSLRENFERDLEIEFILTDGSPLRISLPFALMTEPKAIFKVLRFKGEREHLIKRVNDVIYTFQQAVSHGFVTKERCFVLTDTASKQAESVRNQLTGYGNIIDVTSAAAGKELEGLV